MKINKLMLPVQEAFSIFAVMEKVALSSILFRPKELSAVSE
jgi:hypothetical protein